MCITNDPRPVFVLTDYHGAYSDVVNEHGIHTRTKLDKPVSCFVMKGKLNGTPTTLHIPSTTEHMCFELWLNHHNVRLELKVPRVAVDKFESVQYDQTRGKYVATYRPVDGNVHNFVSHNSTLSRSVEGNLACIGEQLELGGQYGYSGVVEIIVNPEQMRKSIKNLERKAREIYVDSIVAVGENYQLTWHDAQHETYNITFPNTIKSFSELFRNKMGVLPIPANGRLKKDIKFEALVASGSSYKLIFSYPLTVANFILDVLDKPKLQVSYPEITPILLDVNIVNPEKMNAVSDPVKGN